MLVWLRLRVAEAVTVLAPLLGLLVFALADFKPAVTLYAAVVGLALLLRHALDRLGCPSRFGRR